MIVPYVIYEPGTGRIKQTGHCPEEFLPLYGDDVLVMEAEDDKHYLDIGTLARQDRPSIPLSLPGSIIANGVDALLIVLPVGVNSGTVLFTGPVNFAVTLEDNDISVTFQEPGLYTIQIDTFPYQYWTGSINATAS